MRKQANILIDVPFSWCQYCGALEIDETKMYTGGVDYIISRKCSHSNECVKCEKARTEYEERFNQRPDIIFCTNCKNCEQRNNEEPFCHHHAMVVTPDYFCADGEEGEWVP